MSPIYEYECKSCGIIEEIGKFTDPLQKPCPNCEKQMKRIMSATSNPQFKGDGFYETDYKKAKS